MGTHSQKLGTLHLTKRETLPTTEELLTLKAKALKTLVAFRHLIIQGDDSEADVAPAPFHYDWSDSILNGDSNEAWECFRQSAKSQYILRAFPLYQLAFPQKKHDYILLVKNNATQACQKLKEITNEYVSNPIAGANKIEIIQQNANCLDVIGYGLNGEKVETRIEAYGKGTSIRGASYKDRRPKICLIDDPQDAEDAKSDLILENDWIWFMSDVYMLGKSCRIFLIGNNLGDKCIVERVMNNAESLKFKTHRIGIEKDGVPTWGAMFPADFIAEEKEAYRRNGKVDLWLRERMCQSTSEETRVFKLSDFPRFSHVDIRHIITRAKISATLDPAASQNPNSCFRSICVNAVTPENHWMIINMLYGRWDPNELINKIFYTVATYGLKEFGIEKGMLNDFLAPILRSEMIRRQIFFTVIPLEHAKRGTKLERIKMLAPRSKAHSIWLPDYAESVDGLHPWIAELEIELQGVTKDAIKSEFIDLLDSLAMQEQIAQAPVNKPGTAQGSAQRGYQQRRIF